MHVIVNWTGPTGCTQTPAPRGQRSGIWHVCAMQLIEYIYIPCSSPSNSRLPTASEVMVSNPGAWYGYARSPVTTWQCRHPLFIVTRHREVWERGWICNSGWCQVMNCHSIYLIWTWHLIRRTNGLKEAKADTTLQHRTFPDRFVHPCMPKLVYNLNAKKYTTNVDKIRGDGTQVSDDHTVKHVHYHITKYLVPTHGLCLSTFFWWIKSVLISFDQHNFNSRTIGGNLDIRGIDHLTQVPTPK